MIPLHNIQPHHAHTSTSTACSLWKCEFTGCDCSSSFKSRAGLKSHIRLMHSSARPGPSQQHPPHTPNTRHNLQPLTVPLSPSFPPFSPLSSSSSESKSDPDVSPPSSPSSSFKDHKNNDFTMHVDQTRSPSPVGGSHTCSSPTDSSPTDSSPTDSSPTDSSPTDSSPTNVVRSYHPIINGFFLVSRLIKLNAKIIYQVNRVTRMAITFPQIHHRHLDILNVALMIGLLIKAGLSLNWQISSTGAIKCRGATSMNCSACGPLPWSNMAQTHLSNRMATCIPPLTRHPLETAHGRALRYTTTVNDLKTMSRPG
jgi:hypothetical protein